MDEQENYVAEVMADGRGGYLVSSRSKSGRNGGKGQSHKHGAVSPTVLAKARAIAAENKRLSEQLSDKYSSEMAKRIGETAGVAAALREWEAAEEVCSPNTPLECEIMSPLQDTYIEAGIMLA